MTPERQKILAAEILDLSEKIDQEAAQDYNVDLEDYMNLQKLAAILARQVVEDETEKRLKTTKSILTRLLEWAKITGGWEAPPWHDAEQFLASDVGQDVENQD